MDIHYKISQKDLKSKPTTFFSLHKLHKQEKKSVCPQVSPIHLNMKQFVMFMALIFHTNLTMTLQVTLNLGFAKINA